MEFLILREVLIVGVVLLALGIGLVVNAALRRKSIQMLPERRPWFCLLPKYSMELELSGPEDDWLREVHTRIERLGFELAEENDRFLCFKRGSEFGDFSADIIRINIVVKLPATNPAMLGMEYGSHFGVLFDTGDLWKVANAIRNELRESK